jgi:hypothetical protein
LKQSGYLGFLNYACDVAQVHVLACGVFGFSTSWLRVAFHCAERATRSIPAVVFFQDNQRAKKRALRSLLSCLGERRAQKKGFGTSQTDHKNYRHRGIFHISCVHIVDAHIDCPSVWTSYQRDSCPVHYISVSQQRWLVQCR